MEPSWVLGLVAAIFVLLAGWGAWEGWKAFDLMRRVKATVRTKVGALTPGFKEVQGKVRATSDPLSSPMTGKACVSYHFKVEEKVTTGSGKNRRTRWRTLVDERRHLPIRVDDGTGTVDLDLALADLRLDVDTRASSGLFDDPPAQLQDVLRTRYGRLTQGLVFNKTLRYSETVLEEDDDLYVLGTVRKSAGDSSFRFSNDDLLVASDRGEAGLLAQLQSRVVLMAVATLGALATPVVVYLLNPRSP